MLKFNLRKAKAFFIALPLVVVFLSQSAFAANYTVASGDSLYKIADTYNISVATIMQNSNISSSTIYPGQVLNIPTKPYYVKSGDTLYLIAQRHVISLYTLRKLNNKWNDSIYLGQRLIVPSNYASTGSGAPAAKAVIPYTSSDLDLLARLIRAEAEGQPYNAKVSVGAVVVNRVQNPRFPNTIKGVIYQVDHGYYQFTPVMNGWINKPATQEDKNAAYAALHGADPTNGALYYFDDSATNQWLWSKPTAATIGNMVYKY